jgi:hypothetical protein
VNAPAAKFCKGCGVAFAVVPIQTKKKSSGLNVIFIVFVLLVGSYICARNPIESTDTTQTSLSSSESSETYSPPLKLLSMKDINSSEMYFRVIGEIQNTSTEKIDGVFAVVTAYDKDGELVGTQDARIDYSPIMPNQISPFTVMMRQNPLIDNYRINFRKSFSGTIDYTDARPPKTTPKPKSKK